jgi:hypothetical protein
MPSISYLALDAGYDPVFADNTSLTGTQAVSQAILTRLRLFLGEWWEDLSLGLPVFQSMLGQLASQRGLLAIELLIRQNIQGAPYVTNVEDVSVTFLNGQFAYKASVQTAFGVVTVAYAPGAQSALES